MKSVLFAAAVILAGATSALAAPCDLEYRSGGTNPNPVYSPDESQITLTIDFLGGLPGDPGTCNIKFDAHQANNDPDTYEVYSSIISDSYLEAGETATLVITANGRTYTRKLKGPLDLDDIVGPYIGKNADGTIRTDLKITLDKGEFSAEIAGLDYALAGTMTRSQGEASLTGLGNAETAMVTHLDATSGLLTGGNMSLEGGNEVRALGGVGSFMLGGNVRYNLSDGFSVLAGVSIVDQGAAGARYTGGLGALALRFVEPSDAPQRLFGEAGVDGGILRMSFSRTYTDSSGTQTVTGVGTGGLGGVYLRGGMLFELDDSNEIVLSATAKQSFVGFGDYREAVSGSNLFAADLSNQIAGFTTAKLGADWTTALAADLDLTAHLGVGTTIANQRTSAYILGGGTTTGGFANTVFAEYGASLAWHIAPQSTIEGFIQGSSGTNIGTHAQIGAAYRMTF